MTVVLYLIGILLLVIILLALFFLFVPCSYTLRGGYEDRFWTDFRIRFSSLFIIRGSWDSDLKSPGLLKVMLVIAGFTVTLHPEKWSKKDTKQEVKEKKDLPFRVFVQSTDRELLRSGMNLLYDILRILRPDKIVLKGKIGFDEPHFTGWLAALKSLINAFSSGGWFDLEPVWQEEYYELSFFVEGKVVMGAVALKAARFMLARRTRKFMKVVKKEKASYAA